MTWTAVSPVASPISSWVSGRTKRSSSIAAGLPQPGGDLAQQRADPRPRRRPADRGQPVGERDPLGDREAEDQRADPRMLGEQGREALAAERAEDGIGDGGHGLGRVVEGEQRQADNVAGEMEPHDLAAAIAERDAGMEPAGADDEQFARTVMLADHDRAAPEGPLLLLEPIQRVPLALRQAQMIVQPFGQTTSHGTGFPQRYATRSADIMRLFKGMP